MKEACGYIVIEPTEEAQEKNLNKLLQPAHPIDNINDFVHNIINSLLASSDK